MVVGTKVPVRVGRCQANEKRQSLWVVFFIYVKLTERIYRYMGKNTKRIKNGTKVFEKCTKPPNICTKPCKNGTNHE
jgi:hypothetical protein